MLKKGYIVLLLVILTVLFSGCSPVTTMTTDVEGKGNVVYKMNIKKNAIEENDYIVAKDIYEFAAMLNSKFDESLQLQVTADKTSSEEDYIVISYSYNSIEEYNNMIIELFKKYGQLISGYGAYGYNNTDDSNDYSLELEALNEYMTSHGITMDNNHRNSRKFVKIINEYIVDANAACGIFRNEEMKNIDKNTKKEYVKITEDENGRYLSVNYLALNSIEMYTNRVIDKYKGEFFKMDCLEQNKKDLTAYGNKEVLKRTLESIDLANKVKSAIDEKNGCVSNQYSMNDFTPVMTVKLFNETEIELFKDNYVAQREKYEEEMLSNMDNLQVTVDLIEEMYEKREKSYEIVFGSNKITCTNENLFDLYNDESYICIPSNSNEEIIICNETSSDSNSIVDTATNNSLSTENSTALDTSSVKKDNNKSGLLDNTPFTGDTSIIGVILLIALSSLIVIIIAFYIENKRNKM